MSRQCLTGEHCHMVSDGHILALEPEPRTLYPLLRRMKAERLELGQLHIVALQSPAQSQLGLYCLMVPGVCRFGLKAELGAFYPLLLLRPMEAERPEPGQLHSALSALQDLSSQPQLLVRAPDQSVILPLMTSGRACMMRQRLQPACHVLPIVGRQETRRFVECCGQACTAKGTCFGAHRSAWCHLSMHCSWSEWKAWHLQVDLFVNYDCDLQAANLYERTFRGLARIVRAGEASPGVLHAVGPIVNVNAAARSKPYQLAADVALLIIQALDTWADPLKVLQHSPVKGTGRLRQSESKACQCLSS